MDLKETFALILGINKDSAWEIVETEVIDLKNENIKYIKIEIRCKEKIFSENKTIDGTIQKTYKFSLLEFEFHIIVQLPKINDNKPYPLDLPWHKHGKNISHIIQEKIKLKFEIEINRRIKKGRGTLSPIKILGERFKTGECTKELFSLVPEILCGDFAGRQISQKVILKPDNLIDFKDRKGILLCHSLSPFSESIGFYCELGRAFRLGKGLDLQIKVLLAGEDWGKLNWVARDLKLEDNLSQNERWRKMVYQKLGIEVDSCNIEENIKKVADDYIEIVKKCWGNDIVNKRFEKSEIKNKLNEVNSFFHSDLNLISSSLRTYNKTIQCVIEKFLRLDKTTFTYFMAQYHHQIKYNGWFKISIEREQDFDESFKEISESKKTEKQNSVDEFYEHQDLVGLYFEDYVYGSHVDKDNQRFSLTAHPYYFPSANIFHHYKDDLKSAKENCLMIFDKDLSKIEKHLTNMNEFQKGRIISDLLSFAHMLSKDNDKIIIKVNEWMKKVGRSKGLSESWIKYTDINNSFSSLCREWTDVVFTIWNTNENLNMPYHFLPYLWSEFIDIKEESELIRIILIEAENSFDPPHPVLTNDPTKN